MRVRTQLRLTGALSVLLACVIALATWLAVRSTHRAEAEQEHARSATRHAAALLLLTQEYPRFFEERVAQQWRERQASLVAELSVDHPEVAPLREAAGRLTTLFDLLAEVPAAPDTPFSARRSAFLVDQLINETQGVTDGIYRWSRDAAANQQGSARHLGWISTGSIVAVLALLLAQTAIIVRRLLRPLERIEAAAARVARGDLGTRVGLETDDELGHLSREFDAMTASLLERRAAVQAEILRRELTENRLRNLTNAIPALVGYFDADERLRYVNEPAIRTLRLDPARLDTYTMASAFGEDNRALYLPHVPALRAGRAVVFDATTHRGARTWHHQVHLVPDRDAEGELKGFYAMTFDVTALKAAEARMSQLAREDALTGLPNRRQFEERLAEVLARSRRTGRPMALMFLDIDHFKGINDSLGHQGGDVVLQTFADRLRAAVRTTDTVARLAGDEFVVVLEGLNVGPEAEGVARKILDGMRVPITVNGATLHVTTSIGIVVSGLDSTAGHDLTARADEALYRAKRAGRNQFALSTH